MVQIIPFTSNLVPISGLEKITWNAGEIDDEDTELSWLEEGHEDE